jgi:hypothetical protein
MSEIGRGRDIDVGEYKLAETGHNRSFAYGGFSEDNFAI